MAPTAGSPGPSAPPCVRAGLSSRPRTAPTGVPRAQRLLHAVQKNPTLGQRRSVRHHLVKPSVSKVLATGYRCRVGLTRTTCPCRLVQRTGVQLLLSVARNSYRRCQRSRKCHVTAVGPCFHQMLPERCFSKKKIPERRLLNVYISCEPVSHGSFLLPALSFLNPLLPTCCGCSVRKPGQASDEHRFPPRRDARTGPVLMGSRCPAPEVRDERPLPALQRTAERLIAIPQDSQQTEWCRSAMCKRPFRSEDPSARH